MAIDVSANMSAVINTMGSSMTLNRVTRSIDKYGDSTDTIVTETVYAGVNDLNEESEWNKYGIFVPGDKVFFIKASVTAPVDGDQIVYLGKTYEIKMVRSPDSGYISHHECGAKRI